MHLQQAQGMHVGQEPGSLSASALPQQIMVCWISRDFHYKMFADKQVSVAYHSWHRSNLLVLDLEVHHCFSITADTGQSPWSVTSVV